MVWPSFGSRTAKEHNITEQIVNVAVKLSGSTLVYVSRGQYWDG